MRFKKQNFNENIIITKSENGLNIDQFIPELYRN